MKKSASLIKYLALLVALILTISNLLTHTPGNTNTLILILGFAVAYIFLSVTEFLDKLSKSELPYDRFYYLPFSVIGIKAIKLGAFVITGTILFLSESNLIFLGSLVLIILLADLLVFILRLTKKVYYISLFANYILYALEEESKVFASQVTEVEFRYEVFYLKTKDNKAFPIELSRLPKADRAIFTEKFVLWVVCNKLSFTPEAKEQLADIIAQTL